MAPTLDAPRETCIRPAHLAADLTDSQTQARQPPTMTTGHQRITRRPASRSPTHQGSRQAGECAQDATLPPLDSTIVAALISAGGEVLEQGRLIALRPGWRGMCQRGVESVPLGEDLGRVPADDPRPCVLVWLLAGLQLTWPRLPPRPGGGPGRSPGMTLVTIPGFARSWACPLRSVRWVLPSR
jgi:hypothetical protein